MRLQLVFFLILPFLINAQDSSSHYSIKDVDAHFLMHYYSQDGEHSAVQGGQGSEELKDVQGKIIVNILSDSVSSFGLKLGINHYTSASTDQIDRIISSASKKDSRAQIDVSYSRFFRNLDLSVFAGASIESDYFSKMLGFSITKEINNGNSEIGLTNKSYFDNWVIIFPVELRAQNPAGFESSNRNSINNSVSYWQALSERIAISAEIDFIYQYGLLSTPFHRVYFENDSVGVERLPDSRFRIPVTLKADFLLNNSIAMILMYRYYRDDFRISSNTAEISFPITLNERYSIEPSYRYYHQTAAKYFKERGDHGIADLYLTSDHDLSAFSAHKLGLAFSYSPIWRLYSKKDNSFATIQTVSLRYAYYSRKDGLFYQVGSASIRFKL